MCICKMQEEVKEFEIEVIDCKNGIKEVEIVIVKFKEQQNNVWNNCEFELLVKEIEFQELEIQLYEKCIKEVKVKVFFKKEVFDEVKECFEMCKGDFDFKKVELQEIVGEI